jgi:DnaJ-class molecular chaperone
MGKHAKPSGEVRKCPMCKGTGVVQIQKREPLTGKLFWFTEVCACQGG